jgi:peptidoglycan/xylan/chitin deacetylase (PgdA/CDA1 family)
VKPRHFAEHLEVLKKHSYPVPLQQLVQAVQDRKSLNRSVAITFDDGYADNLYNAKPLLEQHNIPATVFVSTGYLEHERESWWDELERLLLQPGTLPKTLCLSINGNTYEWDLGEAAYYSEDAYQRHCTWTWCTPKEADPSPRQSLYRTLYQLLRPLVPNERQKLMDQIITWSGAESGSRSTHRFLSPEEVYALDQGSLIEVGAHTVSHPFLSTLSVAKQQYELQHSKTRLEEIIERPVNSFAYPHGDYTAETAALAREVGFVCACSTIPSKVRRNIDCFELPRLVVQDWDGEEFARQLSRWFYFQT